MQDKENSANGLKFEYNHIPSFSPISDILSSKYSHLDDDLPPSNKDFKVPML